MKLSAEDFSPFEPLVGKTLVLETTTTYPCGVGAGSHPEAVYHPQGHTVTETVEYKVVEVKQ